MSRSYFCPHCKKLLNPHRKVIFLVEDGNELERKKAVKRKLDEIEEHRKEMEDLDSTYNFNLDDDL